MISSVYRIFRENDACYRLRHDYRHDCNTDDVMSCCRGQNRVSDENGDSLRSDFLLAAERAMRRRKQEVGSVLHMRSVVASSHDTELRLLLSSWPSALSPCRCVIVISESSPARQMDSVITQK